MSQVPESTQESTLDDVENVVDAFDEADEIEASDEHHLKYRLPFGFAKRNSVLVQEQETGFDVYCLGTDFS